MAASLIVALVIIAGLGILALFLIFFGGSNQQKQAKHQKDKSVVKKAEEKPAMKSSTSHHKEPYISDDETPIPDGESILSKTNIVANNKVDPAIASLGFSALDDLLPEPESITAIKTIENPSVIAPMEFSAISKQKAAAQDIIVLHVMASAGQPFVGYELLQAVTTAGLRFGKMDIFHYQDDDQPDNVLFSLCSAVEPGTFDLANIGALVCPGLSLFMRISATENSKIVFNLMLETAGQLADDLAGYVCDEKRQPLTDEKLHEYLRIAAKNVEYN